MSNDSPSVPPQKLPHPPPLVMKKDATTPKLEKVVIGSLDDSGLGVEAQYNPKELTIDHSIPWQVPQTVKRGHERDLEFSGGDGRSLAFELLFDGFESGQSVEQAVKDLTVLAWPRAEGSDTEDLRRPHLVAVAWGTGDLPAFRGVIESVQTKYTMFLPNCTPVCATCQVKIKEAT